MNRLKSVVMATLLAAVSVGGYAASHRLATFNVRYCASSDKDGKEWCNRAPFALGIATKYDFDVVGLQELSGDGINNNNSLTGKSQLTEFRESLEASGYTFLTWACDGDADRGYVGIAYKSGRYDLLDSGSFFISPTPDMYSHGWDAKIANNCRVLGWVKLMEKASGDIFYFAATHTNNGWTLDGVYGSQLVADRVRAIAGDYPVMVVADYNMQRIPRDEKAYKAYRASFKDARFEVPEEGNYCLPTDLPPTDGTYGQFNTTASSYAFKEIDYQFFLRMKILERHIVVDTYDYQGTAYPVSDHCPLFVVAELESPAGPRDIYVDAGAMANGDGSRSMPYNSIAEAVANAEVDDMIRVTEGVYNESVVPANSVTIIGGYDRGFAEVTGKTVIDGEGLEIPPVYVPANFSLTIKNCEFRNYRSPSSALDGALLFRGCTLTLDNCDFNNNEAVGYGGAVSAISDPGKSPYYADCNNIIATRCSFKGNKAADGGAIAAGFYDTFRLDGCVFDGNEATSAAGAVYLNCGTPEDNRIWFTNAEAVIVNSSFVENRSCKSGAVCISDDMPNVKFTLVNTTFANNVLDSRDIADDETAACAGAAIHARLADSSVNGTAKAGVSILNLGHVTVTGNKALVAGQSANAYRASAVDVAGGEVRLVNNIIAGNYSAGTKAYADVCVGSSFRVTKDACNVYSAVSSVSFKPGSSSLAMADMETHAGVFKDFMDGRMNGGVFDANIIREEGKTPYARPVSTRYGDKDADIVTESRRNVERIFNVDLDGNGNIGDVLETDQNGGLRAEVSVPGAIEYDEQAAVGSVLSDGECDLVLSRVSGGVYRLSSAGVIGEVRVTDISGRLLRLVHADGATEVGVDLSDVSARVCLITCCGRTFKVVR